MTFEEVDRDSTSTLTQILATGAFVLATTASTCALSMPVDGYASHGVEVPITNSSAQLTSLESLNSEPLAVAFNNVFTNLLENQEDLGAVEKRILYENLWDLYE